MEEQRKSVEVSERGIPGAPVHRAAVATRTRMKRKTGVTILGFAILVLVAIVLSASHLPPDPAVKVDFLGFTNSGPRVEALFALTNPPNVALSLYSVTLKGALDPAARKRERGSFSWGSRETWGLAYAVTVDTTNEPLRVIFEFQRPAVGPRWVVDFIKERWERLKGHDVTLFTGRKFYVTNETSVAGL